MVDSIKIATVNCQGLATLSKRQDVLNFYKTKGYSIICFQDTHFIPEFEQCVEAMWGYKCYFNSYKSNARGVSIFFNNNFEFEVHQERKDKAGNLVALDLTIEGNMVTLINIYGPNTDSPEFYEYVRERLDYILISESLSNSIESYIFKPGYRSDHSIVIVELKFNSFKRGHGLWKFNNSLLLD